MNKSSFYFCALGFAAMLACSVVLLSCGKGEVEDFELNVKFNGSDVASLVNACIEDDTSDPSCDLIGKGSPPPSSDSGGDVTQSSGGGDVTQSSGGGDVTYSSSSGDVIYSSSGGDVTYSSSSVTPSSSSNTPSSSSNTPSSSSMEFITPSSGSNNGITGPAESGSTVKVCKSNCPADFTGAELDNNRPVIQVKYPGIFSLVVLGTEDCTGVKNVTPESKDMGGTNPVYQYCIKFNGGDEKCTHLNNNYPGVSLTRSATNQTIEVTRCYDSRNNRDVTCPSNIFKFRCD